MNTNNAVTELLRSVFSVDPSAFFELVCSKQPDVLKFQKCQPWIVLNMFLNFCQISGSSSYKNGLINIYILKLQIYMISG